MTYKNILTISKIKKKEQVVKQNRESLKRLETTKIRRTSLKQRKNQAHQNRENMVVQVEEDGQEQREG